MDREKIEKILSTANDLGHLLNQSDVVVRYKELTDQLRDQPESKELLDQYIGCIQELQLKEQSGGPIEIADKRAAKDLEEKVRADEFLRELMATQAYYMSLMEQVNQSIGNPQGEPPAESVIVTPAQAAGQSKIILP